MNEAPTLGTDGIAIGPFHRSPVATAPPPSLSGDPAVAAFVRINARRSALDLTPLAWDGNCFSAAYDHSYDMANGHFLSHDGRDGTTFDARLRSRGAAFTTAGECVGAGYPGYVAIVDAWMNSPSHHAILMGAGFTRIGVAVVKLPGGRPYWTADLVG
jgi:uncharacterized protein YkwD